MKASVEIQHNGKNVTAVEIEKMVKEEVKGQGGKISTIDTLQGNIQSFKEDNALLIEENKYLKRKLFGSKSEKVS